MKKTMSVVRKSPFSGKVNEMFVEADPADFARYEEGEALIQVCFPYLSANEREFIKTGITPEEWEAI